MDPITAAVLAGLTAFVTRSTQGLLDDLGKASSERLRKLFGVVKERLSRDEATAGELDRFAEEPKVYGPVIQTRLDDLVSNDRTFRSELQQLLGDIGPQLSVIQRMAEGHGVTGVDVEEFRRGQLTVDQEITSATDVTGARIKTIG